MIIESDNELRSTEPQVHRVLIDGQQVATFSFQLVDEGDEDNGPDELGVPDCDVLYLSEIRVSPEHRRKGVMRSVINRLAEQGRPVVIFPLPLGTERDPTPEQIEELRGWYRCLGFVDQGHLMRLPPSA